jgi:MbtH protein
MSMSQAQAEYQVVINHEEQYSLWPAQETPPQGWSPVGVSGSQEQCLEHIERVWTDMRPASLRRAMEQTEA